MSFPIEDRLLKYLQGKISFNEWLDGAATSSNDVDDTSFSQQIAPFLTEQSSLHPQSPLESSTEILNNLPRNRDSDPLHDRVVGTQSGYGSDDDYDEDADDYYEDENVDELLIDQGAEDGNIASYLFMVCFYLGDTAAIE